MEFKRSFRDCKTHHYRQSGSRKSINKKLLRDVIATIRVLECEIKFVIAIEDVEAFVSSRSRALEVAACTVNINLDVLRQLMSELQSIVAS